MCRDQQWPVYYSFVLVEGHNLPNYNISLKQKEHLKAKTVFKGKSKVASQICALPEFLAQGLVCSKPSADLGSLPVVSAQDSDIWHPRALLPSPFLFLVNLCSFLNLHLAFSLSPREIQKIGRHDSMAEILSFSKHML